MKIWLEDGALEYAYYDNYPMITFGIESNDIVEEVEQRRKAKGMPTFFDETDENYWGDGWYDIYIQVDSELKCVVDLWAEVKGNADKETVPDDWTSYKIRFNSEELMEQINKQLEESYSTTLEELRAETEAYL